MENSPKKWNLKQDKEQRWVNWRCHHFLWVQARDFNLLWPWYNILSDLINIAITSRFPLALSKTYLLDRNALQNEIKRSKLTEVVRNTHRQARWVVLSRCDPCHGHSLCSFGAKYDGITSDPTLTDPFQSWLVHFTVVFFAVRRAKKVVSFRATLNHF